MKIMKLTLCLFLSCLAAFSQDDLMSLRLMTYNIQHGAGMDDVVDLNRQAAIISEARPDVLGLQEVDSVVKRSGYVNEAASLGSKVGMHATFGGAIPLTRGKYGVAILSKEKPLSYRNIPLPGTEARTLLVCEFQEYVFATTHLDLDADCRANSLPIILEEAERWDKPFFICGDWNDKPTSSFITKIKKNFRILNTITSNSVNYTFPASSPTSVIDYIACFKRFLTSVTTRQVINAPEASDHRPVLVEVSFERPTAISAPSASAPNDAVYDLQGRRVNQVGQKGFFIRHGKKYVVK